MMRAAREATAAAIFMLLICACAHGQVVRESYRPGFIELSAGDVADGVDITWEAKQPLDLDFREYLTKAGKPVCVLYLPPGEFILVCDVIDWDARKRTKTTHVITVVGPTPPQPPQPGPTPPPTPEPLSGFAGEVQRLARSLTTPREALLELGRNFDAVASQIAAGGIRQREEAERKVAALNKPLTPKLTGSTPLAKLLNDYLEKNARDLQSTLEAFREIAKGLAAI